MSIDTLPTTPKTPDWGNPETTQDMTGPLEGSVDATIEVVRRLPVQERRGMGRRMLDKVMRRTPEDISLDGAKAKMFTNEKYDPSDPNTHARVVLEGAHWDEAQADNSAWDAKKNEEQTAMDIRIAQDELRRLQDNEAPTRGSGNEAHQRALQAIDEKSAYLSRLQGAYTKASQGLVETKRGAYDAHQKTSLEEEVQLNGLKRNL